MDKPELNEEASLFKGMQDKAPVPVTMEELHLPTSPFPTQGCASSTGQT